MDTRKHHKKILIILGLVFIGLCILSYFVLTDIKNKNQNISSLSNDLSTQTSKEELVSSMDLIIKNSQPDIDIVDSSVVSSDGDVAFIEDFESMAKKDGLTSGIDSLVISEDKSLTSSNMSFFNIKAKVSGSWSGIYLLLAQLESSNFKVKVTRFAFTNAGSVSSNNKKTGTQGNTWDAVFEISVLKYK